MSLSLPLLAAVAVLGLLGIGLAGPARHAQPDQGRRRPAGARQGRRCSPWSWPASSRASCRPAQTMALTVIVADTIVSVVALALAVQVRRQFGTLDLQALSTLRR